MNLQKIGAYIAKKRKELGMTQTELAEKLGMSNKSVSKWERGVCLPDVSLYMELCNILGITINEFIAGEDLPEEAFVEKSDENIIQVTKDGKARRRRLKLIATVLGVALLGLTVVMLVLHMPRQNYIKPLDKDSTEVMAANLVTGQGDANLYRFSVDRSYEKVTVRMMVYKQGRLIADTCLIETNLDEETGTGLIAVTSDYDSYKAIVAISEENSSCSTKFPILKGVKNREEYARCYGTSNGKKRIEKGKEVGLICLNYDKEGEMRALPAEEVLKGVIGTENDYMYCFTVKFE